MKSKFTFLIIAFFLCKLGYTQETYVPDDNFEQALIDLGYDIVLDDYVTTANISGVTYLNIDANNIADLTGIEDFIALTNLYCPSNQLTSLDISQNTSLTFLNCYNNALTSLDVSQNTSLTSLICSSNQISSLDVTQNTALIELSCNENEITSLDVSNLLALETLNIFNNQITNLDITQNILLDDLDCKNNLLTSLDVSQNTSLTLLSCRSNQLSSLDVSQNTDLIELTCDGNEITSLDVSQNSMLSYINCRFNQLTSLNVNNGNNINFSGFRANNNPDLFCIQVDDVDYSVSNWTDIDTQTEFSEDCSLSIANHEQNDNIIIYPNPIKELFKISVIEDADYEIISLNGQIFKSGIINIGENTIDVSFLNIGIYMIRLKTKSGSFIKKLILN